MESVAVLDREGWPLSEATMMTFGSLSSSQSRDVCVEISPVSALMANQSEKLDDSEMQEAKKCKLSF